MKKITVLSLILIVFVLTIFLLSNDLRNIYDQFAFKLPEIEKGITDFISDKVDKIVLTPPPLKSDSESSQSYLTQAGIIKWTNERRKEYQLSPLLENTELDAIARAKVDDMFLNQYFAHVSPMGVGVEKLAEDFGYEFIIIGENLALGNYKNDEDLVQAWMTSPGHRENILNSRYQEIGVAVKKGIYEGKTTWLAVQHFGLSLDACPSPDEKLETQIDINKSQIEDLQKSLTNLQNEILEIKPKRGSLYLQKIEEYNNLVAEYNNLVEATKILINQYNSQVNVFNQCVTAES